MTATGTGFTLSRRMLGPAVTGGGPAIQWQLTGPAGVVAEVWRPWWPVSEPGEPGQDVQLPACSAAGCFCRAESFAEARRTVARWLRDGWLLPAVWDELHGLYRSRAAGATNRRDHRMRTNELPTAVEIFGNAYEELDAARGRLSAARDWLVSDWSDAKPPVQLVSQRHEVLRLISNAKTAIDQAKRAIEKGRTCEGDEHE